MVDKNFYVGYTPNLKVRIEKHNNGLVYANSNKESRIKPLMQEADELKKILSSIIGKSQ